MRRPDSGASLTPNRTWNIYRTSAIEDFREELLSSADSSQAVAAALTAAPARLEDGVVRPAQLLMLAADGAELTA